MHELTSYLQRGGFIPSVLLVLVCYGLLRAARASMWRIALLSLPGTAAHEGAHFLVGWLLRARPLRFSVWPKADGRGWRLGSVSFAHINLLNGAWVALAPLLLLPLVWVGLVDVLLPLWTAQPGGWWVLAGYLTATVLFAALPSWQDLKLGGRSLLCYILLGVVIGLVYWQQSAVDRNPHAAPRALATPDASAARERARAQRA